MEFALEKELMMIGRLLIAGLCGGVIGHERENRRKPAGVRTHTVVGVASALMMLISKYGFNDVLNEYTKLENDGRRGTGHLPGALELRGHLQYAL